MDTIAVADDVGLEQVIDAMEVHLRGQRNVIMDRRDIYSRIQEQGDVFDDFLCAVKVIAIFCDFCETCINNRLRDHIVVGTNDQEALKHMLEKKYLKLQSAINICRASENANVSNAVIRDPTNHTLGKVSRSRRERMSSSASVKVRGSVCIRCGKNSHRDKQMCYAMDTDCLSCGKRGHFAAVWRSPAQAPGDKGSQHLLKQFSKRGHGPKRRNTYIHQVLAGVYTNQVCTRPAPKVLVSATYSTSRYPVVWTPDSGAEATVMGLDVAMSLGIPQTALKVPGSADLFAAGEYSLTCLETFSLELGNKRTKTVVSVVKEMTGALLSWYDSIALGILPTDFPAQTQPVIGTRKSSASSILLIALPRWPHTHDSTAAQRAEHAATIVKAFPRVFGASQTLQEIDGGPMSIQLSDDANLFAVDTCRPVEYSRRGTYGYVGSAAD